MKTKGNKKGNKRSLSKTSLSMKPKRQENVTEFKKKGKLSSLARNGNSTMGNKVEILKKMYKQKEKPKTKIDGSLAKTKVEEENKLSITKLDKESVSKKIMEKKLKNLKKKQAKRNLNKKRKRRYQNAGSLTLSIEEMEAKIQEIRNRDTMSKTAKRILSVLNRKLKFLKSENKSEKSNIIKKKNNEKKKKDTLVKIEQVSNEDNKNKIKVKKEPVQHKKVELKLEIDDQNDSLMTTENEDENDKDQSDTEEKESMDNVSKQLDESDEDEEDEKDKDIEEDEDIEDEEDENNEDIEDDEDEEDENDDDIEDDEDEEDENDEDIEDDEDEENEKAKIIKIKNEDAMKKKQVTQSMEIEKKYQYTLLVTNLPLDVTKDELKKHFLTKVDTISYVIIPRNLKKKQGSAYIMVPNSTDLKKGRSLHHTFIRKNRINVKFLVNPNKKPNVGKHAITNNKKPQVFPKTNN